MKAIVIVLAMLVASVAHADDDARPTYRLVVDRVELEPASISGQRLRVYLSAMSLQGQLLDLGEAKAVKLYLGTSEKKLPYALGTYDATSSDTEIVILVQATADFAAALPMISESLERELLDKINDRMKIAVVTYGEAANAPKLVAAKQLRGKVALASDQTTGDPALLDAIDRALIVLKKSSRPPPPAEGSTTVPPVHSMRKMIIVIGDGRDSWADRDRVTKTGLRAAKDGVRIHTLAYSPADLRRPLLVFGELSKRSLGTFRWPGLGRPPIAETWNDAFRQVATEINKQYVITYFPAASDEVGGKRLHIEAAGRTVAKSLNELKVPPEPQCGGVACDSYCSNDACVTQKEGGGGGGAILKWVLVIGGGVVGVIVLLGFIGWLMSKRDQRPIAMPMQAPMPVPGSVPPASIPPRMMMQQPGLLPNGQPIPALIMLTGPRAGERVTLRNGFLIGKQPGCDLLIEDGYTSSQHAQITMDGNGTCVLYDRGSTNGTFVNGARIQQSALAHGVAIKIGSIEMRFLTQ